jgi:hypothetical protein
VVQTQREDEAAASQPGHLGIQHTVCLISLIVHERLILW